MDWKSRGFCVSARFSPKKWAIKPAKARQNKDLGVYDRGVDPVSAFILVGGQSLRMGENKAFLRLGGGTLLSHALEMARAAAGSACIVGSAKTFAAFGPIIEDVYPQRGPLGGIHAALSHTATDLN